ncbi:polyhydroxyalkanoate depolymerase [Trinickia terrae]|uniref:Polyhydroxyalkanoate depolymerase n=1 Tax=Trinickia terrae TaxID=2571161 RepID=A0A4U1HZE1_9BURK|nr:polyhydroxyalkanoate depolymerase [Trinickia terrae]TKC86288.1 polyhydroxyalkanoate depolymerase [Trinickia terrae]
MWYAWVEAQRNLLRAAGAWAALGAGAWGWPALIGADWLAPMLQPRPEVPPFGIASVTIGRRRIPVAERIADSTPFCALRHFAREPGSLPPTRRRPSPDILICAPLAGHHAVMLRETVEAFLQNGDVYLTDWTDARDVPLSAGGFGLDDYVLVIERFLRRFGGKRIHVVAVCQATAPTLAALALLASEGAMPAASLTLMGGPIDTRLNPTDLARFAQSHSVDWFRRNLIDTVPPPYAGAGRRVYPAYCQQAAIAAAYPKHQMELEADYWSSQAKADTEGVARSLRQMGEYAAVLDMDEHYFLDTLQVIFQEQLLARGTWQVKGRDVRPGALSSIALCTVEGARDNVTGAQQTHAAHALCSGIAERRRLGLTIADCDHYGLFMGPTLRNQIHPAVTQFWRAAH